MASYPVLGLESGDVQAEAQTPGELLRLAEELVQDNVQVLRRTPSIPHPYDSKLFYQREPKGSEYWLGVRRLLRKGHGDCEDLAAYLAAWYRVRRGIHARVVLIRYTSPRKTWYHAVTQLPDGSIEDPSKALGM